MKKLILCFLSIQLMSCGSNKIENKISNDFFASKIIKNNSTNIIVVEESAPKIKALEFYEKAFVERKNDDYFSRKIVANDFNFNSWPIDSVEIIRFKSELLTENDINTYKWQISDFNGKAIIKKTELIKKEIRTGDLSLNSSAFIISKPLMSHDKKYALIFYSSFGYFHGGKANDKVALLRKINEKWVIATYFYDPNIMN